MSTKPGSRVRLYGYKTPPRNEAKQDWRGRLSDFYKLNTWKVKSKAFKQSHPLCAECQRKGKTKAAEVTDHIIPYPLHDFWDQRNWQPLCKSCNNAKGERDKNMLKENNVSD